MRNENERAKKTHQEGGREKEQLKVCACTRARACVCVWGGCVDESRSAHTSMLARTRESSARSNAGGEQVAGTEESLL